jgi:hypothetical protein
MGQSRTRGLPGLPGVCKGLSDGAAPGFGPALSNGRDRPRSHAREKCRRLPKPRRPLLTRPSNSSSRQFPVWSCRYDRSPRFQDGSVVSGKWFRRQSRRAKGAGLMSRALSSLRALSIHKSSVALNTVALRLLQISFQFSERCRGAKELPAVLWFPASALDSAPPEVCAHSHFRCQSW